MRLHHLLQLEKLLELELELKSLATLQALADSIRAPKTIVALGILINIHGQCSKSLLADYGLYILGLMIIQ